MTIPRMQTILIYNASFCPTCMRKPPAGNRAQDILYIRKKSRRLPSAAQFWSTGFRTAAIVLFSKALFSGHFAAFVSVFAVFRFLFAAWVYIIYYLLYIEIYRNDFFFSPFCFHFSPVHPHAFNLIKRIFFTRSAIQFAFYENWIAPHFSLQFQQKNAVSQKAYRTVFWDKSAVKHSSVAAPVQIMFPGNFGIPSKPFCRSSSLGM